MAAMINRTRLVPTPRPDALGRMRGPGPARTMHLGPSTSTSTMTKTATHTPPPTATRAPPLRHRDETWDDQTPDGVADMPGMTDSSQASSDMAIGQAIVVDSGDNSYEKNGNGNGNGNGKNGKNGNGYAKKTGDMIFDMYDKSAARAMRVIQPTGIRELIGYVSRKFPSAFIVYAIFIFFMYMQVQDRSQAMYDYYGSLKQPPIFLPLSLMRIGWMICMALVIFAVYPVAVKLPGLIGYDTYNFYYEHGIDGIIWWMIHVFLLSSWRVVYQYQVLGASFVYSLVCFSISALIQRDFMYIDKAAGKMYKVVTIWLLYITVMSAWLYYMNKTDNNNVYNNNNNDNYNNNV